ncbi:MAG: hypothetical protein V4629_00060, partial [Pseudomonadota bacterium]
MISIDHSSVKPHFNAQQKIVLDFTHLQHGKKKISFTNREILDLQENNFALNDPYELLKNQPDLIAFKEIIFPYEFVNKEMEIDVLKKLSNCLKLTRTPCTQLQKIIKDKIYDTYFTNQRTVFANIKPLALEFNNKIIEHIDNASKIIKQNYLEVKIGIEIEIVC